MKWWADYMRLLYVGTYVYMHNLYVCLWPLILVCHELKKYQLHFHSLSLFLAQKAVYL